MSRIDRLREGFATARIDSIVMTSRTNIRYLSGFSGSSGTLVITADASTLVTDSRYAERAADEVEASGAHIDIVVAPNPARQQLLDALTDSRRVGVEADHVSWAEATNLRGDLGASRVVATTGLVERLRELKDAEEIDAMRSAAKIADRALEALMKDFGPGPSEREVGRHLDDLVLRGGAEGLAFETIVASGPNASRPHHQVSDRPLAAGDLVIIDFGAQVDGYRSDMTRSFVLGEPSSRQREILDGVREAQQAGVDAVAPGVAASAIDDVCRSHLREIGLGEWFTHGTGHGVGLDIHEAPSVSAKGTATLAPGHVVTVEPGVYIPDYGGVRWEDTVVVTNTGAEPLTRSAKQPVVA